MYKLSHLIKQNNLDLPLLESIAKTLYYGTGISVIILDQHHHRRYGHGQDSNLDELFKDVFDSFADHIDQLVKNYDNGLFTFKSKYEFSYLVAVIADRSTYYGSLLLGPFLLKESNEHLINEILREQNFPMSIRTQLKNIYGSIPILNSSRHYYLQQLIASAITNPKSSEVSHIQQPLDTTIDLMDVYYPEIKVEENGYDYALEVLLLTKVSYGDLEKVIELYNEHIKVSYFNKTGPNHLRYSKNTAIAFSTLLSRAIITGGVDPDKALSLAKHYETRIEHVHTIDDLINVIDHMLVKYTNNVLQLSNINHVSVIKSASKYVHMHLSEPIRLNDVADYINLSPNYFSSLFKREMKLSFADYVNQTRIKESQYLLKTTDYSIYDIAITVGYNNQNYFTTIFRKFTGITPKQYRMRTIK